MINSSSRNSQRCSPLPSPTSLAACSSPSFVSLPAPEWATMRVGRSWLRLLLRPVLGGRSCLRLSSRSTTPSGSAAADGTRARTADADSNFGGDTPPNSHLPPGFAPRFQPCRSSIRPASARRCARPITALVVTPSVVHHAPRLRRAAFAAMIVAATAAAVATAVWAARVRKAPRSRRR